MSKSLFEKVGTRHDRWETKGTMSIQEEDRTSDEGVYWLPGSAQGTTPTTALLLFKQLLKTRGSLLNAKVINAQLSYTIITGGSFFCLLFLTSHFA